MEWCIWSSWEPKPKRFTSGFMSFLLCLVSRLSCPQLFALVLNIVLKKSFLGVGAAPGPHSCNGHFSTRHYISEVGQPNTSLKNLQGTLGRTFHLWPEDLADWPPFDQFGLIGRAQDTSGHPPMAITSQRGLFPIWVVSGTSCQAQERPLNSGKRVSILQLSFSLPGLAILSIWLTQC